MSIVIIKKYCICDCGCINGPATKSWMCGDCEAQIHLGDRI